MKRCEFIIILMIIQYYLLGGINIFAQRQQVVSIHDKPVPTRIKEHYRQMFMDDDIDIKEITFMHSFDSSINVIELPISNQSLVLYNNISVKEQYADYQYLTFLNKDASAVLSVFGKNIQGNVYTNTATYVIDTYGEDFYVLIRLTEDIPLEAEPLELYVVEDDVADSNTELPILRVLVLYTPAAAKMYQNQTALLNDVFLNINNANLSFQNSNINARLELAYVGQTDYIEKSFQEDLDNFKQSKDAYMNEVHSLREKYEADICVLLVNNPEYCGLGYIKAKAKTAFCVVYAQKGCTSKYTFAHEIGHLAGCRHDRYVDDTNSPYSYGHGYVYLNTNQPDQSWRTMMSYEDQCESNGCKRIPFWSNPNISYNGIPMGTAKYENNARVWNTRAPVMSAFSSTSTTKIIAGTTPASLYESLKAPQAVTLMAFFITEQQQTIDCFSESRIQILPNTHIKQGTRFCAQIKADGDVKKYMSNSKLQVATKEIEDDANFGNEVQEYQPRVIITHGVGADIINGTIYADKNYNTIKIQIFSLYGNLCHSFDIGEMYKGEYDFSTNIPQLQNGIYIVVCTMDCEQIITKMLVNR